MDGNTHAAGLSSIFDRGHLDHVAIGVDSPAALDELRRRIRDAGAGDGTIHDFGSVRTVAFRDPDGFEGEIATWCDAPPRTFDERVLVPIGEEGSRDV